MKIVADAQSLKNDLAVVSRAVSPRSTLPVLANILFNCENGNPYLAATNLEMAITKNTSVEVKEIGAVTLPAKELSELLGTLSGEITLTLNEKNQRVTLKSKSGNHVLAGINASEFPPVPTGGLQTDSIEVESETFINALKTVVFAASTDEARPILTGVLFEAVMNGITLQAADGFRLSNNSFAITPMKGKLKTVIPSHALNELMRIAHGKMTIAIDSQKTLFCGDDWSLTVQKIEGSFPDLSQVIPTKYETRAFINSSDLSIALKRCAIYNSLVKLDFKTDTAKQEQKLTLVATSEEIGETTEEIPISMEGPDIAIGFNVKFLIEMLGVVEGELIVDMVYAVNPGKFTQASKPEWTHVIMPMHLGS